MGTCYLLHPCPSSHLWDLPDTPKLPTRTPSPDGPAPDHSARSLPILGNLRPPARPLPLIPSASVPYWQGLGTTGPQCRAARRPQQLAQTGPWRRDDLGSVFPPVVLTVPEPLVGGRGRPRAPTASLPCHVQGPQLTSRRPLLGPRGACSLWGGPHAQAGLAGRVGAQAGGGGPRQGSPSCLLWPHRGSHVPNAQLGGRSVLHPTLSPGVRLVPPPEQGWGSFLCRGVGGRAHRMLTLSVSPCSSCSPSSSSGDSPRGARRWAG